MIKLEYSIANNITDESSDYFYHPLFYVGVIFLIVSEQ